MKETKNKKVTNKINLFCNNNVYVKINLNFYIIFILIVLTISTDLLNEIINFVYQIIIFIGNQ
ncbi:hypothetical protein ANASTE_00553 [Anaerofustis stercorihominis DSM 17244]|uniref:Uncharacterized protein n=1 Tax=Anaerofustis stercorihominis DSM 17244 TaxID=445971 RepID=B1C755_9FIRM|nr:hypothetical protein ANASTE_00553 [Anaerofustis stercorihominis DSM 17244]